jgi:glycosyltransferase involved in cell wall biosynthesis
MNIGIDARLLERKITGIGRSLETFLNELPLIDKENKYFLFSYGRLNINDKFYTGIPTVKSFLPQKFFSPIWMNLILPSFLKKNKIDVFFSINTLIPIIKIKNIKFVLVLHDVVYKADKIFHPFVYRKYLQFFTYFSIRSSDLIITVSQYSKQDIMKYYKVADEKIKVVYEAAEKGFEVIDLTENDKKEILGMINFPKNIVLYVGKIENRKNIKGILNIADEIYLRDADIKFVLIGKIGYGGEKLLEDIKQRKNVIYLNNVSDELLKKIYNISTVFLFPSFYEGFGYPPLEAMQSGLPVLASNNTALKEIIGSAGILHDPNDYHSFSEDILRIIKDKEFSIALRKRGIDRAKDFNIGKTVKEMVESFSLLKQ